MSNIENAELKKRKRLDKEVTDLEGESMQRDRKKDIADLDAEVKQDENLKLIMKEVEKDGKNMKEVLNILTENFGFCQLNTMEDADVEEESNQGNKELEVEHLVGAVRRSLDNTSQGEDCDQMENTEADMSK